MEEPSVREPVNGWLHFAGAVLALAGLTVLARHAEQRQSLRHVAAAVSFGATATLLFGASALYHLRPHSPRAKLYSRLDHAMIYLFIAGTYTSICLVPLWSLRAGRVLLATVWTLALVGVLAEAFAYQLPRGLATAIYLGLGWAALPVLPTLRATAPGLLHWLMVGGAFYTVGALVYWRKWPRGRPGVYGFHEIWHTCVIAACASHYWAVLTYVLPFREAAPIPVATDQRDDDRVTCGARLSSASAGFTLSSAPLANPPAATDGAEADSGGCARR